MKILIGVLALALIAAATTLYMNNHWVAGTFMMICLGGLQYKHTTDTE